MFKAKFAAIGAAAFFALSSPAHAQLHLTQAGIDLGFTLSTIVSNVPGGNGVNVLGSAINPLGQVVFNSSGSGLNYVFHNVDGQVIGQAISSTGQQSFPEALTTANGALWGSGGNLRRLNNDGSLAQNFPNVPAVYGMWTNPVTGHIIASTGGQMADIDVSNINAPTFRIFGGNFTDGITVSPDGTIAYGNAGAFRISDGVQVGSYSVPNADGMGVIISTNGLNGDIVVSTGSNGTLVLLDPNNNFAQTVIATGGGYGDYANTDPTTGTLIFGSGQNLDRLGCGPGCGVGSQSTDVPEPASLVLLAAGLVGLGAARRRTR